MYPNKIAFLIINYYQTIAFVFVYYLAFQFLKEHVTRTLTSVFRLTLGKNTRRMFLANMVELRGIEPRTLCLQSRCSPS